VYRDVRFVPKADILRRSGSIEQIGKTSVPDRPPASVSLDAGAMCLALTPGGNKDLALYPYCERGGAALVGTLC
jgi:hypothetical protein